MCRNWQINGQLYRSKERVTIETSNSSLQGEKINAGSVNNFLAITLGLRHLGGWGIELQIQEMGLRKGVVFLGGRDVNLSIIWSSNSKELLNII